MNSMQHYKKFLILATQRTGSNFLAYLLNDHPKIVAIGEVYDKKGIAGHPGKEYLNNKLYLKILRDIAPLYFLNHYIYNCYPEGTAAVGFRFLYNQAEYFKQVINQIENSRDIWIIHLKRRNLFESYVSFQLAIKTGIWISYKGGVHNSEKISIDFEECKEYFNQTTSLQKNFDSRFRHHKVLTVYYEDLLEKPKSEIKKILKFLNVEYQELHSQIKKQTTASPQTIVTNYNELKRKFKSTPWYGMFR